MENVTLKEEIQNINRLIKKHKNKEAVIEIYRIIVDIYTKMLEIKGIKLKSKVNADVYFKEEFDKDKEMIELYNNILYIIRNYDYDDEYEFTNVEAKKMLNYLLDLIIKYKELKDVGVNNG